MSEGNDKANISGVVKWFDVNKGFGFIVRGGGQKDVFVHVTDLRKSRVDTDLFGEGDKVTFDIETTERGPKAVNIAIET